MSMESLRAAGLTSSGVGCDLSIGTGRAELALCAEDVNPH